LQLDREVSQTIGVTWSEPDGVETRKDPEKNKKDLKFGRDSLFEHHANTV
jgi:hypothetical protein